MAKYVFWNFPTYGQVNPTLAIVQELVARGEEVVYFESETFRAAIEATGATFQPYTSPLFQRQGVGATSVEQDNQRLALLPIRMLQTSRQVVPSLLERVRAERPDCMVYGGLFLWARILAYALDIPGVALWPTYAPNAQVGEQVRPGVASSLSSETRAALRAEFIYLRDTYRLQFTDLATLIRGNEGLTIVFLPRTFQPNGENFDERYLFVGPSFLPDRDKGLGFPFARLGAPPRLYISLGTLYNNRAEFYNTCFDAFGKSEWQVVLSLGTRLDPGALQATPENFVVASHVPQLEVLPQIDVFLGHGGMNSTMESLYFGIPLVIIPHTNEQKMTARRVRELGLGIALDAATITADVLREAVAQVTHDPQYKERVRVMQQQVREAGGYQRATDALQGYIRQ